MNLLSLIGGIFEPAAKLIDNLHTSDEERLLVKQELFSMQAQLSAQAMEYEKAILEAKASVILAEAKGDSWLQRNWRPLMMVWFGILLGLYWFGMTPPNMSEATIDNLFGLLKLGIGGYIVGRSAEKIIPKVTDVMKKD